jgi:hypothetical protein
VQPCLDLQGWWRCRGREIEEQTKEWVEKKELEEVKLELVLESAQMRHSFRVSVVAVAFVAMGVAGMIGVRVRDRLGRLVLIVAELNPGMEHRSTGLGGLSWHNYP